MISLTLWTNKKIDRKIKIYLNKKIHGGVIIYLHFPQIHVFPSM